MKYKISLGDCGSVDCAWKINDKSYGIDSLMTLKNNKWVSIENLPIRSVKVEWLCENGVKDVGYYNKEIEEFLTIDTQNIKPITHWRPFTSFLNK